MSWLRARDYSVYQGDIDFTKEPIDIALIKMSGGDTGLYLDPNAAINYQKAKNAGKGVMGWHFLGANIDPITQANYAVRAMMPFAQNDVYGVDFEVQVNDPVNFVLQYEQEFHAKTGCYAIPYMNGSTINAYDWSPVFNLVLPWVAWWGISPDANVPIKYPYIIQQYDNTGTVISNGSRVDEDAVFLTLEEFNKYGYQQPPAVSSVPVLQEQPTNVSTVSSTPSTTHSDVSVPVTETTPPVQSVAHTVSEPTVAQEATSVSAPSDVKVIIPPITTATESTLGVTTGTNIHTQQTSELTSTKPVVSFNLWVWIKNILKKIFI